MRNWNACSVLLSCRWIFGSSMWNFVLCYEKWWTPEHIFHLYLLSSFISMWQSWIIFSCFSGITCELRFSCIELLHLFIIFTWMSPPPLNDSYVLELSWYQTLMKWAKWESCCITIVVFYQVHQCWLLVLRTILFAPSPFVEWIFFCSLKLIYLRWFLHHDIQTWLLILHLSQILRHLWRKEMYYHTSNIIQNPFYS